MTIIYSKFYVFLPKHYVATLIPVGGAYPGPPFCCPFLTQAVTSQAGHIKLANKPLYSINHIQDERI